MSNQSDKTLQAGEITPEVLKTVGRQMAAVDIGDEEAAAFAPTFSALSQIMRSIDLPQDLEPAIIFLRRKEGVR